MKFMCTPSYIKVIPAEIARFGPAAAVVLAHIRWRCETDGPDRILDRGGYRWWRVTQTELGRECGLSVQSVRTALKALGDTVVANYLDPLASKVLAFRPQAVDQQFVESNVIPQAVDQPLVESNAVTAASAEDRVESNEGSRWNQRGTALDLTNALYIETLETKQNTHLKRASYVSSDTGNAHARNSELATSERNGLSPPVSIGATRLVAAIIGDKVNRADATILRIKTSEGLNSLGRSDDDMADCLRVYLTKTNLGPYGLLCCLSEVYKRKLPGNCHALTGPDQKATGWLALGLQTPTTTTRKELL